MFLSKYFYKASGFILFLNFRHPWDTVVTAAYRKYPNPMNGAVTGMDVVRQEVADGILNTERVLQSHFHIPALVTKVKSFIFSFLK